MPSTITATLQRKDTNEYSTYFVIKSEGTSYLDMIWIEKKVPRKHKDKAIWSVHTQYRARSVGDWLYWLWEYGFDTTEFEQACREMGWDKEVEEYLNKQDILAEIEAGDGEYK